MSKLLKILGLGILTLPVQVSAELGSNPLLGLDECSEAALLVFNSCLSNADNLIIGCFASPQGCSYFEMLRYSYEYQRCVDVRDGEFNRCNPPLPPLPPPPLPPETPVPDPLFSLTPAPTASGTPVPVSSGYMPEAMVYTTPVPVSSMAPTPYHWS